MSSDKYFGGNAEKSFVSDTITNAAKIVTDNNFLVWFERTLIFFSIQVIIVIFQRFSKVNYPAINVQASGVSGGPFDAFSFDDSSVAHIPSGEETLRHLHAQYLLRRVN
ncbi:MAG: hypothetical protein HQK53_04530 [Oligoflexia bacterium]|nr:hypothetical protein [Oligoflexia bacterium]